MKIYQARKFSSFTYKSPYGNQLNRWYPDPSFYNLMTHYDHKPSWYAIGSGWFEGNARSYSGGFRVL